MPQLKSIRILVVAPGKSPEVKEVPPDSWATWYPLVDKTTELFQRLPVLPDINILFDEESRYKDMPFNVLIPAPAPPAVAPGTFILDMTKGKGMMPGEPGLGYHEILGTFLIARTRADEYVDLKDEDIEKFQAALNRATRSEP